MRIITLEEAQSHLAEIIAKLTPGEEVVIMCDNHAVARLQPGEEVVLSDNGQALAKLVRLERTSWPCKPGSAKDTIHWMAPDFDAPLDEFKEYT